MMISTTPNDDPAAPALPPGSRVAVIAGSGRLPVDVVAALVKNGQRPLVVALEGEAEMDDNPAAYDFMVFAPEALPSLLPRLKREAVTHLVLAGGVSRRPRLGRFRISPGLVMNLPRLLLAYTRGDDGLLRALIRYVEGSGIRVVGAHEIAPDILTPGGILTHARPMRGDRRDIMAGLAAAKAIGALDIGQAAIAIGGRAIALEGIEGTDGLLSRTRELRDHGRLAGKLRGVLVKAAKPGQELRADLPAIGPDTIGAAEAAGLAGIAMEAERSLILDFEATVARANERGLFIVGLGDGF